MESVTVSEFKHFLFYIPKDLFYDPNNQQIVYKAYQSNMQEIPDWIHFNS